MKAVIKKVLLLSIVLFANAPQTLSSFENFDDFNNHNFHRHARPRLRRHTIPRINGRYITPQMVYNRHPVSYLLSALINSLEINSLTSKNGSNIRRTATLALIGSAVHILIGALVSGPYLFATKNIRDVPLFVNNIIAGAAIKDKGHRIGKADLVAKYIDKLPKKTRESIEKDKKIQFALLALETGLGMSGQLAGKPTTGAPLSLVVSAIRNILLNKAYKKVEQAALLEQAKEEQDMVKAHRKKPATTVDQILAQVKTPAPAPAEPDNDQEKMLAFIQEKLALLKPGEKLEQKYITYLENLKKIEEQKASDG